MEPNNQSTQMIPAYLRAAEKTSEILGWLKSTGLKWCAIIGISSAALVGIAWLLKLQLGTGIYYAYTIISVSLFAWSLITVSKMIAADRAGNFIDPDIRWLVFGKLASSCFSIITVATISMVDPQFSFLSQDLPVVGVSIGETNKKAVIKEKANKGELEPEAIGLNKTEGIQSVGIGSGFEGVENHPQMRAKANVQNASFSTAYSAEALKQMHYRYFIRVFKEREGFNPKIYWDKTQWSIGYGSFANDLKKRSPNMTVSKDQAYDLALKELDVCRTKAKSDFPWLSHEQELVLTDLYYNAGKHSVTGLAGQRKAGSLLPVLKKYHANPNSVTYDQLYSAFVEAKDCGDCEKGKRCGHQERRRLNVLQFLSNRSPNDFKAWKYAYDKVTNIPSPKNIAGL